MVRTSLSAVVVASAAILLATSVTPAERALAPPSTVLTGAGARGSAGSGASTEVTAPSPPSALNGRSEAVGDAPGGGTGGLTSGRVGAGVHEGLVVRGASGGAAPRAAPAAGAGAASARGAARPAASTADRARWRWPVRPRPPVVRPFQAPLTIYGAGHRGLDLAVAEGTPVLAVEGGVVTHAGPVAGRGTVTVAHPGGLSSTYEPV
ncbi:MAG: M23 family metallopeptidase, partial [Ornithinibacter sp.]